MSGQDPYLADQIRRLEEAVNRQQDRFERDQTNKENDRRYFQQELNRIRDDGFRRNGSAQDVGRQMMGNEDDDLIRKLNDLEHYLTNQKQQAVASMPQFMSMPYPVG